MMTAGRTRGQQRRLEWSLLAAALLVADWLREQMQQTLAQHGLLGPVV